MRAPVDSLRTDALQRRRQPGLDRLVEISRRAAIEAGLTPFAASSSDLRAMMKPNRGAPSTHLLVEETSAS